MIQKNDRNQNTSSTTRARAALSNIVPKKLNKWSAILLAFLFVPVFAVAASKSNQHESTQTNNQEALKSEAVIEESMTVPVIQDEQGSSSEVKVKANTQVQGNSSSQVRVQGSVSTTTDEGTKTETFDKTYNSAEGDASNSFNVNVDVKSSGDSDIDIDEDSSVEIDVDEESEVRISN